MPQTSKKLNFMIRNDIARELDMLVPPGRRSQVVNNALEKELAVIKRKNLTEKLLSIREEGPSIPTKTIVEALKKDRERRR